MTRIVLALGVAIAIWAVAGAAGSQDTKSTEFTFQGKLNVDGAPATGVFDFQFTLLDSLDADVGGGAAEMQDVTVTGGVFTVALDFGAAFNGDKRFLQIEVSPDAPTVAYTTLSPNQELRATPYSLFACDSGDADMLNGQAASYYLNATAVLNGTMLEITDGSGANMVSVDLSTLQDGTGTDDQTLAEVLASGSDAGGASMTNLNTVTATGFVGDGSLLTNLPGTNQTLEEVLTEGNDANGREIVGLSNISTNQITLESLDDFVVVSVAEIGDVGESASLAIVDGFPAIAYHDNTANEVVFVRATDALGTAWGSPVTVSAESAEAISLAVVDGHPAVAYSDGGDTTYVRALNAQGTSWGGGSTTRYRIHGSRPRGSWSPAATPPSRGWTRPISSTSGPATRKARVGRLSRRLGRAHSTRRSTWRSSPAIPPSRIIPAASATSSISFGGRTPRGAPGQRRSPKRACSLAIYPSPSWMEIRPWPTTAKRGASR